MGWLPFGSSAKKSIPSPQVDQKSHQPLNLDPESDISHTLDQLDSASNGPIKLQKMTAETKKANDKMVDDFVNERPANMFIIDGEKYKDESIICTNNEAGGKTCLKLRYNSIELFKQMQRLEYFCSLPDDINATYFECRKIK